MLYTFATGVAYTVCVVSNMIAWRYLVGKGYGAVTVIYKSKGNKSALGDKDFVSIYTIII